MKRPVTVDERGRPVKPKVKALYTIPELAALAHCSRFRMARLLETHGVQVLRSGRAVLVPLSELEYKVHPLLEAIEAAAMSYHRLTQR
jgi:hypothetical protein